MPQIKMDFDTLGNCKVDAEGFQGESCLNATQALEKALAGVETNRNLKPEYDESPSGMATQNANMNF